MNNPAKIVVERTSTSAPMIVVHFAGYIKHMSEDTAQVLGRALQQVAFGEKDKLTIYEESNTRPAGLYA